MLNPPIENIEVSLSKKKTMLPLLVVLFLVSYSIMALLVVEQGRTIDAQRNLIRQLFSDSTQLTAMKGKEFQKERAEAKAQAQAEADAHTLAPSHPPASATPKEHAKRDHKLHKPLPSKPPQDASDDTDVRRALVMI